jgi:hypothetical protein
MPVPGPRPDRAEPPDVGPMMRVCEAWLVAWRRRPVDRS